MEEEKNIRNRVFFCVFGISNYQEFIFSFITYGDISDDLKKKNRISSIKIISMFPNASSTFYILNNLNIVLLSRKDDGKAGYQGIRYSNLKSNEALLRK